MIYYSWIDDPVSWRVLMGRYKKESKTCMKNSPENSAGY